MTEGFQPFPNIPRYDTEPPLVGAPTKETSIYLKYPILLSCAELVSQRIRGTNPEEIAEADKKIDLFINRTSHLVAFGYYLEMLQDSKVLELYPDEDTQSNERVNIYKQLSSKVYEIRPKEDLEKEDITIYLEPSKEKFSKAAIATGLAGLAYASRIYYSEFVENLVGGAENRSLSEHFLTSTALIIGSSGLLDNFIKNPNKEVGKLPINWITLSYIGVSLTYLSKIYTWEVVEQYNQRGYVQWDQIFADITGIIAGIAVNQIWTQFEKDKE